MSLIRKAVRGQRRGLALETIEKARVHQNIGQCILHTRFKPAFRRARPS